MTICGVATLRSITRSYAALADCRYDTAHQYSILRNQKVRNLKCADAFLEVDIEQPDLESLKHAMLHRQFMLRGVLGTRWWCCGAVQEQEGTFGLVVANLHLSIRAPNSSKVVDAAVQHFNSAIEHGTGLRDVTWKMVND